MTSLRMALTELIRITAGRLPRAAVIALVLVPTLYGGLYLYANHDPYGRLDHVPAALVVLDQGAQLPDGTSLTAGKDVAAQLRRQHDFDWHEVTEAQARKGIREGRYDFGLAIPKGFSAAFASTANFDPQQAKLEMITNDANSYLSTTIANTVVEKVRAALSQKFGEQAAEQFLDALGTIRKSLVKAAGGATQLADGLDTARRGSGKLARGAGQLDRGTTQLAGGLDTLATRTRTLPSATRHLAAGSAEVAAANHKIAGIGDDIASVSSTVRSRYAAHRTDLVQKMEQLGLTAAQRRQLLAVYDRLGTPIRKADATIQKAHRDLDRLSTGAGQVAAGNRRLANATPALVAGIGRARSGSHQLSTGAHQLATGAQSLHSGLGRLDRGAGKLADGLHAGVAKIPSVGDATSARLAKTLGDPVAIKDVAQTSAGSYGAGLAPFFLSLAAWIGGYVLFLLVRPLSQRAMAANQTPVRVAIGGWLTPVLLGIVQMTVMLAVVLVAVRIDAANLAGTFFFLLLTSATFIAIVHALNAWLGSAGQFLGLVLMVLQLVTCGGTFPWQTIPGPLYFLHHILPMSYALDGMRQLMYGGLSARVAQDVLVLLLWLVVALFATSRAARKQRVWSLKRVKPELTI
ncbi:MAG TPA: YhgE/Pip domain-containing protein [Marmoricola sp.]